MALCGAKTRSGGTCKRAALPNGRCKFHGGASLAGPAHPNWKGGRHSKYLPKDLAERYQEARIDPHLTDLKDELALVDVRIAQLLEALGETGSARLWKEARTKFDAFKRAGGKGKAAVGEARLALQQVDDILASGLTAAATWDDLREMLDLRRRLSESETRRLRDRHQMIPIAQVIQLMTLLVDEVKQRVTDREVLTAISGRFLRLVGRGGGATAPTVDVGR